jgi:hypothetical protein
MLKRMTTTTDERVERLNTVSARRVLEPEGALPWDEMREGRVLDDELLSVRDLDLALDDATRAQLSREETASMLDAGIRFEAALTAGFALQIADAPNVSDPRVTYMLHEIGEESRHSRAFARLVAMLGPRAQNPLDRGVARWVGRRLIRWIVKQPTLLMTLVLAGEEIPDLLQRLASEHPGTDPLVAALNRYHRQEEARHLSFAHAVLPELWAEAPARERRRVHHLAPRIVQTLFDTMIHPGVYAAVGLPAWPTWRAARRSPTRVALRHAGTRPILDALVDAGAIRRGRVPRAWRDLCGVDRHGRPVPGDVPLPGTG